MKKFIVITILLVLAGILYGWYFYNTYNHKIVLTQKQIQAKLDEKFPVSKIKYFIEFTFNEPKVLLKDGSDRIDFLVNVFIKTPLISMDKKEIRNEFNGQVNVECKLYYVPDTGYFHLNRLEIKKMEIKEIPEKYNKKINTFIKPFIERYVDSHPIYKLNPKNFKQEIARVLLKKVYVENNNLIILLSAN